MKIECIDYNTAKDFLLPRHYSGRIPSISYAFGFFSKDKLVAVCTFGKPASPPLCIGICGKEFSSSVFELNRLCRIENFNNQLSSFVAGCLRKLKPHNLIIVSYSDTAMNHHGYIYQACNFIYTGMTKQRTDKYTEGNKHARHYDNAKQNNKRKVRSAKHRYVYFAMNKTYRRKAMQALRYKQCPYPKGDNSNYLLGTILQPKIIRQKQ